MPLVSTPTKLPLPRWAQIMGINPIHFAGVQFDEIQRAYCDAAWFRYEWQASDRVGWEELARAIRRAEDLVEAHLGFHLIPDWTVDERVEAPRPYRPELVNITGRNVRQSINSVYTRWAQVVSGGVRAATDLGTSAIAYASTREPAAWLDQATITVPDPGTFTDPCQARVFYPGHGADPLFEIRPLTSVSSDGATITITFPRELAVTEAATQKIAEEATPIDGLDNANFLTQATVYRVYNDPSTQVSFLWEPDDCADPAGVFYTQSGLLLPRDFRMGEVGFEPGTWDAANQYFIRAAYDRSRQPDQLRLYYYSGLRDESLACPSIEMNAEWAQTVAWFAASMLSRDLCGCVGADSAKHWAEDLAFLSGDQRNRYNLDARLRANPFGTRRGAVEAWRRVTDNSGSAVRQGAIAYR